MNRTQSKKNGHHRARGAGGAKARHKNGGTVPMTLRGLRESVGRTQGEVARKVSMTQPQLSRVEARRDHLISTLRRYVHALGGEIEVVAVVNGERIALQKV
jgi:predicted transcriptional regulator